MELDEFHIRNIGPSPMPHRDTITRGDSRIRRGEVKHPCPTARKHDGPSSERVHLSRWRQTPQASNTGRGIIQIPTNQVENHPILENPQTRLVFARSTLRQSPLDLSPSPVPRMQNPLIGMTSLACHIVQAISTQIEFNTMLDEVSDPRRSIKHNRAHNTLVAQPRTRGQSILHMGLQSPFIINVKHTGYSALRPVRRGGREALLGDDGAR
jgi:hypothetical protein